MTPGGDNPHTLDRAALERMYVRLERPVYNVVLRWVWDAQVASEIVQDSFVKLWRKRDQVDADTADALVYRIAVNLAKNHNRWKRLRTFLGFEVLDRLAGHDSPEANLSQRQADLTVRAAIDALPEKQRQVILLSHYSGLSYAEIAEIAGVPEGTVASRRNTALRALRTELSDV